MAFRLPHSGLPRRVSGYFLLFFAAALLWTAASIVLISLSETRRRAEASCLASLGRASSQIRVEDVRQAGGQLQKLMERLRAEGGPEYCAVVSCEGKILAHSSPERAGQVYEEPAGEYASVEGVGRLRFHEDPAARAILEYRMPLRDGNGAELATLHMAFCEPDPWGAAVPEKELLPWVVLGPAACMVLGTVVLRRSVRPLAAIETQLNRAVVAVCPSEVEFDEVPSRSAAALGWNRLVESQRQQRESSGLDRRAAAALEPVLAKQGNHVLNSLPDGIALSDEEGRITFANQALGAICGAGDGGGLEGKAVEELLDLRARQGEAKALLAPNARGRTVVADVRSTVQGSPRVLRVARHPCWGPDGRADSGRHVWSVRDVTQQQLVSQTRDQFLQTAAHELRTPLSNIKAYVETLSLDDTIDPEKQKEFYNVINAEATRLARLIEDLLNVSSMEAGALSATREETDVGRLVAEVIDKVKPLLDQKKLDFQTAFPQKWPKTHLDKDKIATSLVNVLGNAAKYTPAGGRVAFRVTVDDNKLTMVVEDSGIGISEEELPRISEKFFRSADPRVRQQPGSGLGLSLVKEIARLHGGSFDIRSEVDKGTAVKITLPIV